MWAALDPPTRLLLSEAGGDGFAWIQVLQGVDKKLAGALCCAMQRSVRELRVALGAGQREAWPALKVAIRIQESRWESTCAPL